MNKAVLNLLNEGLRSSFSFIRGNIQTTFNERTDDYETIMKAFDQLDDAYSNFSKVVSHTLTRK
jgi:hypothetical protein